MTDTQIQEKISQPLFTLSESATELDQRESSEYAEWMRKGINAFNRAREDSDVREYQHAAEYFKKAQRSMPESTDAILNEAYARLNAGEHDEAVEPLESYVARTNEVNESTYTILGQLYLTKDRIQDAVSMLQEATETYPENEELQSLLLNAFNALGDDERAIEAYEKQIERSPNNAQFRYNYGSLLLTADRFDEAIDELKVASELDDKNVRAFYNLGAAYINRAAAIDDKIKVFEGEVREADGESSDDEHQMLDVLASERDKQFHLAIHPLERAYQLTEPGDEYRDDIRRALFQSYVNTDQIEKANKLNGI
jgi:tetratricopeptide (TPR) repeat protein